MLSSVIPIPGMTTESERYVRDLYDHLIRISDMVDSYRDLLSGSLDAYMSVVSNRLNDVMKQLTIIATVFLPLSFLTGFFGQNFALAGEPAGLPGRRSSSSASAPRSWPSPACSSCSAGAAGCKTFFCRTERGASGLARSSPPSRHPGGVRLTCVSWQNRHLFLLSRSRCWARSPRMRSSWS